MSRPGQSFYAVVELLDHQLVDRSGRLAGKADDAEIRIDDEGVAWLDALLTGPGVLASRLGHRPYGRWRERVERLLDSTTERRTRVPVSQIADLDVTIRLALDADHLASQGSEDWARRHVIAHIPGARHEA
jgi:hypothetical protein